MSNLERDALIPWPLRLVKELRLSEARLHRTALLCGGLTISYEKLIRRVYGLVQVLQATVGIERGSRVVVAFGDTPESWVSFSVLQIALGVIGSTFTVYDTRSKAMNERAREHMIEMFQPQFFIRIGDVICPTVNLPAETALDWTSLDMSPIEGVLSGMASLASSVTASDGAFVDWTSGSTGGLPKGCVCAHRTLSNMYDQKWGKDAGFLAIESIKVVGYNLFFLWYWWQPLLHGGSSVLLQDSELRDISVFYKVVRESRMDAIDCLTPSLLSVISRGVVSPLVDVLPKTILVSGEPLGMDYCDYFLKTFPDHRLINMLSTTETGDVAITEVRTDHLNLGMKMCPLEKVLLGVELTFDETSPPSDSFSSSYELVVGGVDVGREYIGDPVATQKGFCPQGWRSRDLVLVERSLDNSLVRFSITGRLDDCVKLRGFKVDLGAVSDCAKQIVPNAIALAVDTQLVLFAVGEQSLRESLWLHLRKNLSTSHVPQRVELLNEFPLTRTGKIDKTILKSLVEPQKLQSESLFPMSHDPIEQTVLKAVSSFSSLALPSDPLSLLQSSFWGLGGTSLMAIELCHKLGVPARILLDSKEGTLNLLVEYLGERVNRTKEPSPSSALPSFGRPVAVIGMSGRWPGINSAMTAEKLHALLTQNNFCPMTDAPIKNMRGNVHSGFFLDESLLRGFDCGFWNVPAAKAALMDPHQRLLAEMAIECFIDAGIHTVRDSPSNCGVFASSGSLSHWTELLLNGQSLSEVRLSDPARYLDLELNCDKDYLALRVAKLLNLTGPAVTVQAACASALVAVCQAVTAVQANQCEMALCGGISLVLPQESHASAPGLIWSPDGQCRPFDDAASGTANCNGGHLFLLKDWETAKRDNNAIYGIISGAAFCNDGHRGKDFVAPSASGHMQAIRRALGNAGRDPEEVSMVECHGTGTIVGDPMEYEVMKTVYRREVLKIGDAKKIDPKNVNAKNIGSKIVDAKNIDPKDVSNILSLGSVKGNVGHANTAAGALGLAKALMCVRKGVLVKSGNFEKINRNIALQENVVVQDRVEEWSVWPRIAGVSSLGMGGTNAHVLVEQAEESQEQETLASSVGSPHLLLSSGSLTGLHSLISEMGEYFSSEPSTAHWNNVAFTLGNRVRARDQGFKKSIQSVFELQALSRSPVSFASSRACSQVAVLFPGQGVALPSATGFSVDPHIISHVGFDPLARYWSTMDPVDAQVALFAVEYTVGRLVVDSLADSVDSVVLCGHSLGEYAAACLAGLLDLDSALSIVAKRASLLIEHTRSGSMAAVVGSEEEVRDVTAKNFASLEIACINRRDRITITGPTAEIERFVAESGRAAQKIETPGAYHSRLAEPAKLALVQYISEMFAQKGFSDSPICSPKMTFISTLTGEFLPSLPAAHWGDHLRQPVQMAKAMQTIAESFGKGASLLVDVGPGTVMRSYAKGVMDNVLTLGSETSVLDSARVSALLWERGCAVKNLPVPDRGTHVLGLPTLGWNRTDCWPIEKARTQQETKGHQEVPSQLSTKRGIFFRECWVPVGKRHLLKMGCALRDPVRVAEGMDVSAIGAVVERVFGEGRRLEIFFSNHTLADNIGEDLYSLQVSVLSALLSWLQALVTASSSDRFIDVAVAFAVPDEVLFGPALGLLRCAISEHPDLGIAIVRVGAEAVLPADVPALLAGEYRIEGSTWWARRVERVPEESFGDTFGETGIRKFLVTGGTGRIRKYLVTGGTGGIGTALLRWLLREDNVEVHLLVRPGRVSALAQDARVKHLVCDLLDGSDVRSVLSANGPYDCVLHLAGEVKDGLVSGVDVSQFAAHMAGKLLGAQNILSALGKDDRTPVVLFSSTSGLLGSPGQCVYAAGNTGLDCLARERPNTVSLQFGGWSASLRNSMSDKFGLTPIEGCERYLEEAVGMGAIESVLGMLVTGKTDCIKEGAIAVADIYDWHKYAEATNVPRTLVSGLFERPLEGGPPDSSSVLIPSAEQCTDDPSFFWMLDHVDSTGEPLVPATGLVLQLLGQNSSIGDVKFSAPLRLGSRIRLNEVEGKIFCVSSDRKQVHASAMIPGDSTSSIPVFAKQMINFAGTSGSLKSSTTTTDQLYRNLAEGGFAYGPCFRLVRDLWQTMDSSFVVARVGSEKILRPRNLLSLLAATLDACTHAVSLVDARANCAFPSAVRHVWQGRLDTDVMGLLSQFFLITEVNPMDPSWVSLIRPSPNSAGYFAATVSVDVVAVARDGEMVCFEGLELTPVEREELSLSFLAVNESAPVVRLMTEADMEGSSLPSSVAAPITRPFKVHVSGKNLHTDIVPVAESGSPLVSGQIRVSSQCWGLSFLDVLAANGVMPDSSLFGGEFSGIVTEVGPGSHPFQSGDRVAVLHSGGFASECVADVNCAVRIPDDMSFEAAATVPVSFCTALFALQQVRQWRPEMTVLIHNVSGALGMAIVSLLRESVAARSKINIIGTCSGSKRQFVQNSMGITTVLDSRNFSEWPIEQCVDVSIGAMHPDLLTATVPLMRSFGTVVDVGKRLQTDAFGLNLAPFVRGLTFTTAHLDELMRVDTQSVKQLLEAAVKSQLPFRKYPIEELSSALKFLAGGTHTGKVVVSLEHVGFGGTAKSSDRFEKIIKFESLDSLALADRPGCVLVHDSVDVSGLTSRFKKLTNTDKNLLALIVVPERMLLGPDPVPAAFRPVRQALLQKAASGRANDRNTSEKLWVHEYVARQLGRDTLSEELLDKTLEQSGIDSLGRLQLWHAFRRQFPKSRVTQFSNSAPLKLLLGEGSAERKTEKHKWLAIHGFRTNPTVIEHQLREKGFVREGMELVCPKAPIAARGPCPVENEEGFEWWSAPIDTSYEHGWLGHDGLTDSLSMLETLCGSTQFEGVIGFSQGAGLAHALLAKGMIKKGILFSPVNPQGVQWPPIGQNDITDINVIVISDANDKTSNNYPFGEIPITLHELGHVIPVITQIPNNDRIKQILEPNSWV